MSQDADGSGLVSLLWGLWIYWSVSLWCEYLSSLSQEKKELRPSWLNSPIPISSLKGSAASANLEALVSEILRLSGSITVNDFLDERLAAYESIVAAFDAGDRNTLRELVSSEVYDIFSETIAAREARREKTETSFSRIEPPEIVAGLFDETHAEVSIRFVAESYQLSRSASGQPIGRTPDRRHSIDIWTFGCTSSSPAGEWRLVGTEAGV
jgi:predicted lipid-binding transport protein (Tim44 family)